MRVLLLLLLLCALVGYLKAQDCSTYSNCTTCVSGTACAWCSLTFTCVPLATDCSTNLNLRYTGYGVGKRFNFTTGHCDFGLERVVSPSKCSRATITKLTYPLDMDHTETQAKLFDSGQIHYKFPNNMNPLELVGTGVYILQASGQSYTPYVATTGSSLVNISLENIKSQYILPGFTTILGQKGDYQLGYVAGLRMDDGIDCIYVQSKKVTIRPAYENIFSVGNFAGVIFYLVVFSALAIFVTVFQNRFEDPFDITVWEKNAEVPPRHYLPFIKHPILDKLVSLFYAPQDRIVFHVGTPGVVYFWIDYILIGFSTVMALLGLIVLIPIFASAPSFRHLYQDVTYITLGSLNLNVVSPHLVLFCIVAFLITILLFVVIVIIRVISRTVVKSRNDSSLVVMVSGLSKDLVLHKTISDHFKSLFGADAVQDACIAYDGAPLRKLIAAKSNNAIRLKAAERQLKHKGKAGTVKGQDAISYYKSKLGEVDGLLEQVVPSVKGSGVAFVTFKQPEKAKICIEFYKNRTYDADIGKALLDDKTWKVVPAPIADDIIWENLSRSSGSQFIRHCAGNTTLVLLIIASVIGTSIIKATNVFGQWFLFKTGSAFIDFFIVSTNYILFTLLPQVYALANVLVAPMIRKVSDFEKHKRLSYLKGSLFQRIIVYAFLNTLIIPFFAPSILHFFRKQVTDDLGISSHAFFNDLTVEMSTYILAQTFSAKAVPTVMSLLGMLWEFIRTQKLTRPRFDYEVNYAMKLLMLLVLFSFGSMVPILTLYGFIYFVASHLIDRWLILHFYAKEKNYDASQLKNVMPTAFGMLLVCPLYLIYALIPTFTFPLQGSFLFYFVGIVVLVVIAVIVDLLLQRVPALKPTIIVPNEKDMKYASKPIQESPQVSNAALLEEIHEPAAIEIVDASATGEIQDTTKLYQSPYTFFVEKALMRRSLRYSKNEKSNSSLDQSSLSFVKRDEPQYYTEESNLLATQPTNVGAPSPQENTQS